MQQKSFSLFLLVACSTVILSCNQTPKPMPEKTFTLYNYFDNVNKQASFIKGLPIGEDSAKEDVAAFYANVSSANPQMKCLVDVTSIDSLLAALKNVRASGIRLYSAAYTPKTAQAARNRGLDKVNTNDYHLIIVPIDAAGKDIEKLSDGRTAMFDYNHDCPFNCPKNLDGITLINEVNKSRCNQPR